VIRSWRLSLEAMTIACTRLLTGDHSTSRRHDLTRDAIETA